MFPYVDLTSFSIEVSEKDRRRKIHRFITMLRKISINVPFIEPLEKMPGYAKFIKDMLTKKRSDMSFEDDDRLQHCSAIAIRSLM